MKKNGDGRKPDKGEDAKGKKKPVRSSEKAREKKSEKTKKRDDSWLPFVVIGVILLAMVLLIYVSSKSEENIIKADLRDSCYQRFKSDSDLIMTFISYRRERGAFPDNLQQMREFLKASEPSSDQGVGEKVNSMEKDLYDTWKRFYCPSGEDDYSIIYTYEKPADSAPADFVIIKCTVHRENKVSLGDIKKAERTLEKENPEKLQQKGTP